MPCYPNATLFRLFRIVNRAFMQRGKKPHNTLNDLVSPEQMAKVGVSETVRGETLSLAQFADLASGAGPCGG